MFARIVFVVAVATTAFTSAAADESPISGKIFDSRGMPIAGATVEYRCTQCPRPVRVRTDGRGKFLLRDAEQHARLVASSVGFLTLDTTLATSANRTELRLVLADASVLSRGAVVTGSRPEKDDPVTQSVVTTEAVSTMYAGQDPQYLLERASPSVVATSESGTGVTNYGTFRLRGIDQTRVNITVDGVPINDMIDQGVFFSNIGDLANGMSSIFVQRGVGATTNGTASYAGSVDFSGADLSSRAPMAQLQASVGSFSTLRGSATIKTGRMENNVSVAARYTSLTTDGYRNHTGTSTNSLYATAAYFGATDVLQLSTLWGRSANQLGYLAVPRDLAEQDRRSNINDSVDNDNFGQYLVQLRHTRALSTNATLTTTLYAGGAGGDYFTGYRDENALLTVVNYPLENRHYGGMSTVNIQDIMPGTSITAGVHAYTFRRRNWETVVPEIARPYYADTTVKNELSGFVRARLQSGPAEFYADVQVRNAWLHFYPDASLSVAAENIPVQQWLFVNPRFGVRYSIWDGGSVYASFGRTGREPTRFDLLGSTQITADNVNVLLQPNTVRPEFVNNIEAGVRFEGTNANFSVNAFAMFFTDEIAPIGPFIEQGFVQLRKNVASSRRIGVEAEGNARLFPWLETRGTITVMRSNVDEFSPDNAGVDTVYRNVQGVLTPPVVANLSFTFMPTSTVWLEIAGRYVASSFADLSNTPNVVLPSFAQIDARIWWQPWEGARVGLMGNNLTNALVVTSGGSAYNGSQLVPTYFVQAGRNVMLTTEITFGGR